jgi:hypothetical protein
MEQIKYSMVLFLTSIFIMNRIVAQESMPDNKKKEKYNQAYFGLGAGLDYGGIGLKAEFLPAKWLGIFAGGGYNLLDPAYNAGLSFKMLPGRKVQPVLTAMYGYNAVIKFKGRRELSKTYYGATVGVGCEVKYGTNSNKLSFALLVPFRSSAFHSRYKELKDRGHKFDPDILPIAFSLGCNFAINKKEVKKKPF